MQKKLIRVIGLLIICLMTSCSFSKENKVILNDSYDEPVLKLSADYSVGHYIYKDGKEYYIHQNDLIEHRPEWKTFTAMTEVDGIEKEFSFQWYEQDNQITIANESHIDAYCFETVNGNTSYVLLVLFRNESQFKTFRLCDLENNKIVPLFEDELGEYSVDYIILSPDLSHGIVSAEKGEQIFIFDGEKAYSLDELVSGGEEKSYGARFVENQILILETGKMGDKEIKSAYLYDYKEKSIKKTVDGVSFTQPDKVMQKGKYMYYPKDGILNITNLVTGTTVETNVSYDDLYDISILLEEQIVVATQEGNILLLDSETGSILNKQETGLEMIYSDSAENYSFERVQSNEGLYVAIYRNGEEVAIYKLTK